VLVPEEIVLNGMDTSSLTKENIIQLIKNHDGSLTFVKPKKLSSSSSVWSSFSYVYFSNRKQDFVSCDQCKDILQHRSIDGTSSMMKHIKSSTKTKKNAPSAVRSIQEYLRSTTSQPIPRKFKEKITDVTVEFVASDNRAFELISGVRLIGLAHAIFDVGQNLSKTPNVNISNLLPNPTTISKNYFLKKSIKEVDEKFLSLQKEILLFTTRLAEMSTDFITTNKSQLVNICENSKFYTIVVDFWTDAYNGRNVFFDRAFYFL
jgi:hypothetical protein